MTSPNGRHPAEPNRFAQCLAEVLDIEGGYSNRPRGEDPGGATMCGITWKTYNAYRDSKGLPRRDVRQIERHEVYEIYWSNYWLPVRADDLPPGLDLAIFDFGVNSGPGTAVKQLQRVLGEREDWHLGEVTLATVKKSHLPTLIGRYVERRRQFGRRLKNYQANRNGWETRWNRIERSALMACGAHEWAADVQYVAAPAQLTPDEISEEQGRAIGHEPEPSGAAVPVLGTSGLGGIGMAFQNAWGRVMMAGRVSVGTLIVALLLEPLFWVSIAPIAGAFWVYFWRKEHRA